MSEILFRVLGETLNQILYLEQQEDLGLYDLPFGCHSIDLQMGLDVFL